MEWVESLARVNKAHGGVMQLAGHLCGAYVPQVLSGDASFVKKLRDLGFGRVQINATSANGVDTSRLAECVAGLRASMLAVPDVQFIVQRNDESKPLWEPLSKDAPPNMSMLYDASCGKGVAADWFYADRDEAALVTAPPPHETIPVGYAGGMGPANIENVLPSLALTTGATLVWVDMESSLRDIVGGKDIFSIDKCFVVLHKALGLFVHVPVKGASAPDTAHAALSHEEWRYEGDVRRTALIVAAAGALCAGVGYLLGRRL